MQATREDVISCYRHILGREPENEETLNRLIGWDFWQLVNRFSHSDEHRANVARLSSYSPLKFRREGVLARNLSDCDRLSSILHNYSWLRNRLQPISLIMLMETGFRVVDATYEGRLVTIDASMFDGPAEEGEVSLIVSLDGRRTAVLSFTFIAGEDFGLPYGPAILLSRLQGYRGVADDYAAFKALTGMAPSIFVFSTLEGIAAASGIGILLAVKAHNHPTFRDEDAGHYERAYDFFFEEMGGKPDLPGFYRFALPRQSQPLDQCPPAHRARRRKRRLVRQKIADQACTEWQTHLKPLIPSEANLLLSDRRPSGRIGWLSKLLIRMTMMVRSRDLRRAGP